MVINMKKGSYLIQFVSNVRVCKVLSCFCLCSYVLASYIAYLGELYVINTKIIVIYKHFIMHSRSNTFVGGTVKVLLDKAVALVASQPLTSVHCKAYTC